jgi:CHAT domain-containing protein
MFLEYVVSGDRVLVLVADAKANVTSHDLGSIRGLADMVDAYRRVVTSPAPGSERLWIHSDGSIRWNLSRPAGTTRLADRDDIERTLSRRLLEPLMPRIGSAASWIISPDGPLAFLPFEALRVANKPVIEGRALSYSASLSSLAAMPARVTTGARLDFLGVGISRFGDAAKGKWPPLPRAEDEVRIAAQVFSSSLILRGSEGTEVRLRQLALSGELQRYRILHFATHAFLSDRSAGTSGVVMADVGDGASDGVITAAEWPTFRLGADLVVLSACDTGLGRLVAGEGVVGLPTALLVAGSRSVIVSLWSVSDESAAEFMPLFYKRLKAGKSPAEALRETKLEFARSKGPYSSPRHWAPYVLYGAP